MDTPATRLAAVRALMQREGLDALLVPRADEYLGEYVPEHNERLRWLTGFSGSAGMAIVLPDQAAIFVDGRYTVQVRQQVPAELFEYRDLVGDACVNWLVEHLGSGQRVAHDPRCHTAAWQRNTSTALQRHDITLVALDHNPVDACWHDCPVATVHPGLLLDARLCGQASMEKRRTIGSAIASQQADAALIFAADSVAWLLNLRGFDIPHVPLVLAHAVLYADGTLTLFTDPRKLPQGFARHAGEGVSVHSTDQLDAMFAGLAGQRVLVDQDTTNAWCRLRLEAHGARVIEAPDPVLLPKACKNPVEIGGMRAAHLRDAVAMVRFLAWLDAEITAGRLHDEARLAERLHGFRARNEHFHGLSFDTISAAGANAAIVHYRHSDSTPGTLGMDSVYLVDSGAQYLDGTTDITRTIAIGDPDAEVRRAATLVMKGHIALARARFPVGTTGSQLDALARQFLWQHGFDYDHGTGHGVGCFLSVHEGPQRIGKIGNTVALAAGMVLSNEPGYYREGAFGIRHENLLVVTEPVVPPGGERPMHGFEELSLVPFDLRLIDPAMLSPEEVDWIDRYHARIRRHVAPLLDGPERDWLERGTRHIGST